MNLSREQQEAFDKYTFGENIFITGPGGCGKTELIRHIYNDAIQSEKRIQVCALTGCASILLNCKAKTIHSWAGIGLGNGSSEDLIKKIRRNKHFSALWKTVEVLIIDEISMMSLKLFNNLYEIAQVIRKNKQPFGGIQIIFSGDFYQLPPIGMNDNIESQSYCFESEYWNTCFVNNEIQLITIFRQTDTVYSTILNEIRKGKIKRKSVELLNGHINKVNTDSFITMPTKLYPIKYKVDNINKSHMESLEGIEYVYPLKYVNQPLLELSNANKEVRKRFSDKDAQYEMDFLASNVMCEKSIKLKKGAQVMYIVNKQDKNEDQIELCNGSQGIVDSFEPFTRLPIVLFNNGIKITVNPHTWQSEKIPGIGVSQIPLILSWAITIHKSQGCTLECAEVDVGHNIFECGQTYVALSRVKSLDGLYLTAFDVNKIKINKKVQDYYEQITNK